MRNQNRTAFLLFMILGALSLAVASFYFTHVNPFDEGTVFPTRIGITALLVLCTMVFSLFTLVVHPRWVKRMRRKRRALWIQMAIDLPLLVGILVTVIVVWIKRWPLDNVGPILSLVWPPLVAYVLAIFLVYAVSRTDDFYEPCTYPLMPGADTVNTRVGYVMRLVPLLSFCLSSFFVWGMPSVGPAAKHAKKATKATEDADQKAAKENEEAAKEYEKAKQEAEKEAEEAAEKAKQAAAETAAKEAKEKEDEQKEVLSEIQEKVSELNNLVKAALKELKPFDIVSQYLEYLNPKPIRSKGDEEEEKEEYEEEDDGDVDNLPSFKIEQILMTIDQAFKELDELNDTLENHDAFAFYNDVRETMFKIDKAKSSIVAAEEEGREEDSKPKKPWSFRSTVVETKKENKLTKVTELLQQAFENFKSTLKDFQNLLENYLKQHID